MYGKLGIVDTSAMATTFCDVGVRGFREFQFQTFEWIGGNVIWLGVASGVCAAGLALTPPRRHLHCPAVRYGPCKDSAPDTCGTAPLY